MLPAPNHRIQLARRGEEAAARHLVRCGLKILARNFACPGGELDIVASDGAAIVFVEVKARVGESGLNQAIGFRQIGRLKKMARVFLEARRLFDHDYRFLVAYVVFQTPADLEPAVTLIEDPF